jgi:pimeloyl-ACP methyl ester carboxylesterase
MSRTPTLGDVREAEIPAGTIRYRERGDGPPIVFVHGIIANGDLWRGVVPGLADRFRCVTPDWPLGGHELPLRPGVDLSLVGLARMVDDFLAALDLEDVVLVGNDTGGAICQAVAAHVPDRVGRLVLTGCDSFDNFVPPILKHLEVLGRSTAAVWLAGHALRLRPVQRLPISFGLLTVEPIEPGVMDSYTRPLRERPLVRRDFAELCRRISSRYTEEAAAGLPGFPRPALVVWGLDDRLFPLRHAHRIANLLPDARLEVLEECRSFVPEDQPAALARLLREFAAPGAPPQAG